MSATLSELPAAEEEQLRNVRAFMFERFNRVGMTDEELAQRPPPRPRMQRPSADVPVQIERAQPEINVERLHTLADAVRAQLLRQVEEADLRTTAYGLANEREVPISQDTRRRDLLLVRMQANVNVELAAIAYLEARGDLINAIMSLDPGTARRGELEAGLRSRMAQLGARVLEGSDGISEERRQVIREARRAFQLAALQHRERQVMADNQFVDDLRDFRQAMIPDPNVRLGRGKTDRGARHRGMQRQAIRSEMEELEAQVEACTIDENTYNLKAIELRDRFKALSPDVDPIPVTSHFEAVMEMSRWLRENSTESNSTTPPVWYDPPSVPEPPEEVD